MCTRGMSTTNSTAIFQHSAHHTHCIPLAWVVLVRGLQQGCVLGSQRCRRAHEAREGCERSRMLEHTRVHHACRHAARAWMG
jgi:hypothetical protein